MKVVILASAELDLKELRSTIVKNFSHDTWQKTYSKLKESIRNLATHFRILDRLLKSWKPST